MQNITEMLELENEMIRVFIGPNDRNEENDELEDYYEDEDEEWGNTF